MTQTIVYQPGTYTPDQVVADAIEAGMSKSTQAAVEAYQDDQNMELSWMYGAVRLRKFVARARRARARVTLRV